MVRMIPDPTRRFAKRPYYPGRELDHECEAVVSAFLTARYGQVRLPITTDEITILIEQHCEDLDLYADLSGYGIDVEGMSEFFRDHAPNAYISERLTNDTRRKNRLRTTLAHEFGHIYFHRQLWAEKLEPGHLFDRRDTTNKAICKRDTILNASEYDWMEWQAGYVSGAILMPLSALTNLVSDYCQPRGLHSAVHIDSPHAQALVSYAVETFRVSEEAARVRLLKLDLITNDDRQASLF